MSKICAGDLRHKITFQAPTNSPDGCGGGDLTWSDVTTAWAKIAPVSAGEKFMASKLEEDVSHKITIRYNASVTSVQRIKFGTRTFKIVGVLNPEERNEWLQIFALEQI
jgi:SPP1 family predicted phage head-tail adaptor